MAGTIYYFCTARHGYALAIFAAFHADELAPAIRIIPYRNLPAIRSFGPGAFVFSDIDRLSPAGRNSLAPLADHLAARGCQVLNHPTRTLLRFDLLRKLHDLGINRFDVYRLADWQKVRRYPVFIRGERTHGHTASQLLGDREALRIRAEHLLAKATDPDDLMVVEFVSLKDGDGQYRKYAAFRVGDHIYGHHLYASRHWWVKFGNADVGPEAKRAPDDYARDNPHREQLEAIFKLAETDYGRADYGMIDGQLQLFEINTNPTVVHATSNSELDVSLYPRLHKQAMAELLASGSGPAEIANPLFAAGKEMDMDAIHAGQIDYVRDRWGAEFEAGRPAPGVTP